MMKTDREKFLEELLKVKHVKTGKVYRRKYYGKASKSINRK